MKSMTCLLKKLLLTRGSYKYMLETTILISFIIFFSAAAYALRALTLSGAGAASIIGSFTVLGFGIKGLILLALFFVTSSMWSKYGKAEKRKVGEMNEKGDRRDWHQVLANGGIASLAGVLYFFQNEPLWLFAFSVALASANSDTWASEIGTLSRRPPFSLRTFSFAQTGSSGAISALGTSAALVGSLLIAVVSYVLFSLSIKTTLLIFIFGFLGNAVDTILGAYFQAVYRCRGCRLETEKLAHCGQKTELIRGNPILNNDVVNFLSGLIAVLLGIISFSL